MPITRRDIPQIRRRAQELYDVLQDLEDSTARFQESAGTVPHPSLAVGAAVEAVLAALMPSGVHDYTACPDLDESTIHPNTLLVLHQLRRMLLDPVRTSLKLVRSRFDRGTLRLDLERYFLPRLDTGGYRLPVGFGVQLDCRYQRV